MKELIPWPKVKEGLAYNRTVYKFLAVRQIFANLIFDFSIIYFNIPAFLWYMYTDVVSSWGMCAKDWSDSGAADSYNLQLLVGLFSLVTYRAGELLIYTPWSLYDTFCIEAAYGMSRASCGSFVINRFAMLIEYCLLVLPVFLLIVKVQQWTGDFLVLAFFLLTAIVKGAIVWLYPKIIHPITASKSKFPEKHNRAEQEIHKVCHSVGFNVDKIWLE